MAGLITLSIEVSKVEKGRFRTVAGTGGKPDRTYLDLALFETPDSPYGDYIVKHSATKDERERKVQLPIIGNGKKWEKGTGGRTRPKPDAEPVNPDAPKDEVPF